MKNYPTNKWLTLGVALGAFTLVPSLRANDVIKQQLEYYNTKIAPVLAEKCYKCHSGTEDKVKGGLTLDSKEGMLRGGDTGPAVVPGNVEKSLLIRAIAYGDEDMQMPPKEKLPSSVVADFAVWIKMGAPVPQSDGAKTAKSYKNANAANHWAFKPVTKPAVPTVNAQQWVKNEIDNFIVAKLEAKNMYPNKPADKRTLIRRATFDLTGLPPTPEEVKAFLADDSSNAYEKLIDRLLASPQYGERWGRYWLDVARYADTKGEVNGQREDFHYPYAYTYRDYVIKAFNDDKPYDQFIMEQLAADRMNLKDKTSLAALGFLTLGNRFDNQQNEIINDRIDTVTKGFQALTVACSRCHDHMFDPLPTEDYYALHGILASSVEPKEKPLIADVNEKTPEYQAYLAQRAKLENDLQEFYRKDVGEFVGDMRKNAGMYLAIIEEAKGKPQSEVGALVRKHKLNQEAARLWQNILRGRRNNDPVMGPYQEFAKLSDKEFATKSKEISTRIAANADKRRPINPFIANQFRGVYPQSMAQVAGIYGRAFATVEARWQEVSARNPKAKALPDANQEAVRMAIIPGARNNEDPLDALRRALPRNLQGRETRLRSAISQLEGSHPGAPARAMVINDAATPRDSYVFIRGEAGSRGPVVPRRYLEIFSEGKKPFTDGSGRLELAKSIASKDNPLTARVAVNRIWMHHFGDGFVLTPDDFGTQSTPPSHPELLDYLAGDFMANGWSVKALHKKIMMTYAYQQSSENNAQFAQQDPYNRLLWRANIRRLEFEALRDSLLAMGDKLDKTMGGKPVNLMAEPYSTRRTVYGYIDRAKLPEVMNNFDFANPDITTGKRYETIVPQQSLFMMNSPLVVEQARNLTERKDFKVLNEDEDRIKLLYELIFQRLPSETEIKLGLAFLNSTPEKDLVPVVASVQEVAQANPKAKGKAKGKGMDRQTPAAKPAQKALGAWDKYAHALLQTNEATFVN